MADKVYKPEVVQDTPFPGEAIVFDSQKQSVAGGNYSPNTTRPKQFKKRVIAHETIASALNTRSRKILQEFDLEQSGGFRVGNYQSGVSGDLRITPNGLTARDSAGLTTFSIDGITGDAVFRGTLQAGSVVAGDGSVVIEESSEGNGRIVLYNDGIPEIVIGDTS